MQIPIPYSLFAILGTALLVPVAAYPQAYPSKPIRIIAPFATGGSTDTLARTVAQKLSEQLGVSVIVENRTGAGGSIGTDLVAKSPPDGYTLLLGTTSTLAVSPALFGPKLPFDVERNLAPVTLLAKVPLVIAVHPSVPARSLGEFITLARARPGKVTYGSSGNGTTNHLIGAMVSAAANINMIHVPYKGGSQALLALLGGEVDTVVTQIPAVASLHRAGKVRVVAISGAKHSSALPGVQTMVEGGLSGLDATSWSCLMVTAGTPRPVIDRLHAETVKVLNIPDTLRRLTEDGSDIETSTPEALGMFIKAELPRWAKAVKDSGARID